MYRRQVNRFHSARNGAEGSEIRHGNDVRRRGPGRGRYLREVIGDMATAASTLPKTKGGAFLIEERTPHEIFTPEDLTDEHRAIGRTADEFWNKEVGPHLDEIDHGNHDAAVA